MNPNRRIPGDEVLATLDAIEHDADNPPTRAELLEIARIKAMIAIGQSIGELTFR
ncbi:MAG TPA: hypothetical protein VN888_12205 [Mycobacterium sp.]|nr:hypothetical protein [Mycobacterium sp.]